MLLKNQNSSKYLTRNKNGKTNKFLSNESTQRVASSTRDNSPLEAPFYSVCYNTSKFISPIAVESVNNPMEIEENKILKNNHDNISSSENSSKHQAVVIQINNNTSGSSNTIEAIPSNTNLNKFNDVPTTPKMDNDKKKNSINSRATNVSNHSSRYNRLPIPLHDGKLTPIIGKGFGSSMSYSSQVDLSNLSNPKSKVTSPTAKIADFIPVRENDKSLAPLFTNVQSNKMPISLGSYLLTSAASEVKSIFEETPLAIRSQHSINVFLFR